ncbi:MAG: DUF58 domain-containing protein [Gammaproteobacteria bacterium]
MKADPLGLEQRFCRGRWFMEKHPICDSVVLTQRRIFMKPTRRGLGVAFTVLLLVLIAFIYNSNQVYLLAFLLASILLLAILHTYQSLAGLKVEIGRVQPVFAGESAGLPVTVSNLSRQPREALSLSASSANELNFSLDASDSKTLTLQAAATKRGWQMIDTVTLASDYPLGAFQAWSPLRFDCKILVYPEPTGRPSPLPNCGGRRTDGEEGCGRISQDDFSGIRAYEAGDSLRRIHWKAYAKGQGLLSKQFESGAGGADLWLDYDKTPGGHIEARLSLLCRWVVDAEAAGLRYGLLLPGRKIAPGSGRNHRMACLKALALF